MRKICSYPGCKVTVEVKDFDRDSPRCSDHPAAFAPKRIYKHHYHNNKHIYSSGRWKKLRAYKVALNPLCEMCEKLSMVEPVADVDHIKEIKDGGDPWDIDNLMSLCRYHHSNKTQSERKKRKAKFPSISDF